MVNKLLFPHGGSTYNLVSTGLAVSEVMSFENNDNADDDTDDGQGMTAYPITTSSNE